MIGFYENYWKLIYSISLKLISANLMVHFWKNTEKIIFNLSKKRKDKKKNISWN